jgi:hypothetical protein
VREDTYLRVATRGSGCGAWTCPSLRALIRDDLSLTAARRCPAW